MKKISFFLTVAISVMLFSCNSGTQTEEATDTSSSATTDTTVTAPAVFTPFDIVRLQLKVKDYGKFHTGFMNADSFRLANGIHKYILSRGLNGDSNMVIVFSKIDDLQKAKAFYASADIKKAMQQGGITGMPKPEYFRIIRSDTTTVPQDQRVSVTHHVKDFDAWLKVYEAEGKDTRAANGMVDRALARGIEDSNMVSIVFIVTDMAKAKARIASPDLKKLMTDAGVDSPPVITFYRNVEKF